MVLVILIPSVFILALVLSIIFVVFIMLFFPLMPIAFLLLPGIIFVGIVWLVYRMGETPSPADTSTALQPVPKQKLSNLTQSSTGMPVGECDPEIFWYRLMNSGKQTIRALSISNRIPCGMDTKISEENPESWCEGIP